MPILGPNGTYCVDRIITINGVKHRLAKSLKTKNKSLAEKLEKREIDEFTAIQLGVKPAGPAPTFDDFVSKEWKPWATSQYANRNRTWNFIQAQLRAILAFEPLKTARINQIDERLIDQYECRRRTNGISDATLNRDLAVLRLILKRASRWHKIPLPEFPHFKEERRARVVTQQEEEIYSVAVDADQNLFFKILIDTAMEPGVAAALDWSDFDFQQTKDYSHGAVHARGTKSEFRDRVIPMTARLRQLVMGRWLAAGRPESGCVFPSERKKNEPTSLSTFHSAHMRLWGKRANKPRPNKGKRKPRPRTKAERKLLSIPYFRFYDLRHTALTRMGEGGVSEIELMKIAGWGSTQMAARYVHPSKRRMGKAIERFEQHLKEERTAGD